jgi:hypothetical protein
MNPPNPSDDFRERMSAWHDGALPAEAARFVARRVLGEAGLRAELGRWQLVGDVLRRQPVARPPADLAGRVGQVLHGGRASSPPAWPWAAAVAGLGLSGILGVLLFSGSPAGGGTERPLAAAPAASAPALPVAPPVVERSVAQVPVEPPLRPILRPAAAVAEVPALVRAPQPSPAQLAPLPPAEPIPEPPARPWPRGDAGSAAFVVDYRVAPPPEGR